MTKRWKFYRVKQKIKRLWRNYFPLPIQEQKPKNGSVKPLDVVEKALVDSNIQVERRAVDRPFARKPRKQFIRRCIATQKFMFSREQAEKKRDELLRKKTASYLRIYLCQFCDHWHLTHKKNYM